MSDALTAVTAAVGELREQLDALLGACADPEGRDMAELLDVVRSARSDLLDAERDVEAATAKAMMGDYAEGPGLRVERSRATERKAWDHETWQRDVRAKAVRKLGLAGAQGIVNAEGELVEVGVLHELLAAVQGAHGASAPKTTTLRQLGLDARDYCESTPGAWRVKVTRMAEEDQAPAPAASDDQAA